MSTTTLRPEHDTTPHCELCGAEDVSLSHYASATDGEPDGQTTLALCADCDDISTDDQDWIPA